MQNDHRHKISRKTTAKKAQNETKKMTSDTKLNAKQPQRHKMITKRKNDLRRYKIKCKMTTKLNVE